MINKDDRIGNAIGRMIADIGLDVFKDPRRANALLSDYFPDGDLTDERKLLKRVIDFGVLSALVSASPTNYLAERQKTFYVLTERELIASSWAERVLNWFDLALGKRKPSQDDEVDCITQTDQVSAEAEGQNEISSLSDSMSPIDMLLDENNSDNIVMYNEDDEAVEFKQIALIPLDSKKYTILKPVKQEELGIADDEVLVFVIDKIDGEDVLCIVEDNDVIDRVFEEYRKLLKAQGYDVY